MHEVGQDARQTPSHTPKKADVRLRKGPHRNGPTGKEERAVEPPGQTKPDERTPWRPSLERPTEHGVTRHGTSHLPAHPTSTRQASPMFTEGPRRPFPADASSSIR